MVSDMPGNGKRWHTSGTKGGWHSLFSRPSQSILENQGCCRISSIPRPFDRQPSRVLGSRSMNWGSLWATRFQRCDGTHSFQGHDTLFATPLIGVIWEAKWILDDWLRHLLRVSSIEGTFVENEFKSRNTQTPPINLPWITFFADDLWSHVGHTSSDTSVEATFRIVNSNIKICDMGMAHCIQENVIGLQVSVRLWAAGGRRKTVKRTDEWSFDGGGIPMRWRVRPSRSGRLLPEYNLYVPNGLRGLS